MVGWWVFLKAALISDPLMYICCIQNKYSGRAARSLLDLFFFFREFVLLYIYKYFLKKIISMTRVCTVSIEYATPNFFLATCRRWVEFDVKLDFFLFFKAIYANAFFILYGFINLKGSGERYLNSGFPMWHKKRKEYNIHTQKQSIEVQVILKLFCHSSCKNNENRN